MYDDIRRDLLNGANALLLPHGMGHLSKDELVNILLYGHETLSLEINAKILSATLGPVYMEAGFPASRVSRLDKFPGWTSFPVCIGNVQFYTSPFTWTAGKFA